ncbi:MAG: aromatic amino acid hydroxylase [Lentimicrobium sp.]|nr:aromatic amino acid hydroxylase [Lentimicrobium sp.]
MQPNEVTDKLPRHLNSLIINQPYCSYTAQDHAVWRYVMRQNVKFLSKYAHGSYVDGLRKTGISIDTIPHMYGMNRILKEIGWAAVAVDGFIPPSAFMEFQAYNVLVIAADIRPIDQIAYTPAPDIIHEAAGHAPIIADAEYANYLKFFGEIGSKAFSSARDHELYKAIRHLSILKANPYTTIEDIKKAENRLLIIEQNMGEPSEMARIRNLHWWTVEYGLIGEVDNYKIYGAGLLSSIGESMNCIKPVVKKLPYTIDAANFSFDITNQQPQLFVTPDFRHLNHVLDKFADGMALRTGGINALKKAEESENTATIVLSSGLQVSGTFAHSIIENNTAIYYRTNSPSSLCFDNKELPGHGKSYHSHGFGSPLGNLIGNIELSGLSDGELEAAGIRQGEICTLNFESGIVVKGVLEYSLRLKGQIALLGFSDCTVKKDEQILFKPEWGIYDMSAGGEITSAYPGPADPEAFDFHFEAPKELTHKIEHSAASKKLHLLYQLLRDARDNKSKTLDINLFANEVLLYFPKEWLLLTEIYEFLYNTDPSSKLVTIVANHLDGLKKLKPELSGLIADACALFLNE